MEMEEGELAWYNASALNSLKAVAKLYLDHDVDKS